MPIKLSRIEKTVPERIDALRHTIKLNEGMTMAEVAAHPLVKCASDVARNCCAKNKWTVKNYDESTGKVCCVLVHPKTLSDYETQRANTPKAGRK